MKTHKKINITLRPDIKRRVDAAAKASGMTRSAWLVEAALRYIAKRRARVSA